MKLSSIPKIAKEKIYNKQHLINNFKWCHLGEPVTKANIYIESISGALIKKGNYTIIQSKIRLSLFYFYFIDWIF